MDTHENVVPATAFAPLSESRVHWSTRAVGYLVPTALVIFFATTTISFMAPIIEPIDTHESVHVVFPVLEPAPKGPEPVIEAKKVPAPKPIVAPKVAAKPPVVTPPPIEAPKVEVAKVTPPPVTAVTKPDTFRNPELASTGSSAPVTEHKPSRQVQTGGFGDPNGVPRTPIAPAKARSLPRWGRSTYRLARGRATELGEAKAHGAQWRALDLEMVLLGRETVVQVPRVTERLRQRTSATQNPLLARRRSDKPRPSRKTHRLRCLASPRRLTQ